MCDHILHVKCFRILEHKNYIIGTFTQVSADCGMVKQKKRHKPDDAFLEIEAENQTTYMRTKPRIYTTCALCPRLPREHTYRNICYLWMHTDKCSSTTVVIMISHTLGSMTQFPVCSGHVQVQGVRLIWHCWFVLFISSIASSPNLFFCFWPKKDSIKSEYSMPNI